MLDDIYSLLLDLPDPEKVKKIIGERLESGEDPMEVVNTLKKALDEVGDKYENGEFFLSELMLAGDIASEVTEVLDPYLDDKNKKSVGKIVIGTVRGDIHNIGKDINITLLKSEGFEIIDLGVDVPAERFADAVEKEKPDVLGMSALLTSTMDEIPNVIDTLNAKGLRDNVKIIIGGRPVDKEFADKSGVDAYAGDAISAVKKIRRLVGVEEE